jgi:hypothetical protein
MCDRLFPPLLLPLEITNSRFEDFDRVFESAKTTIATVAKKSSHFAGPMIVINGQPTDLPISASMSFDGTTNSACSILLREQCLELIVR